MITKLTIVKCPCGAEVCDYHGFREGTFYQGTGFSKEDAEHIAECVNTRQETIRKIARLERFASAAKSCILSGEKWTDDMQRMFTEALGEK